MSCQRTTVSERVSDTQVGPPAMASQAALATFGNAKIGGRGRTKNQDVRACRTKASEKTGYIISKEELEELADSNPTIVVDWMARWCRKCIYLKPKLEKLCVKKGVPVAFVDVNNVPSAMVRENGVQHMPTIQVWHMGAVTESIVGGMEAADVVAKVERLLETSNSTDRQVDSRT